MFDFWIAYWSFVAFVFGAIVGSFLNVCIWRLPREESLSDPPSHCPACQHTLQFIPDMIPLLSQVRYGSRCRYCGTPFSWRYFWVELITAVIFAALYLRYALASPPLFQEIDQNWIALAAMLFMAALIAIFAIDLELYLIPDLLVYAAVAFAVALDAYLIWRGLRPLWQDIPGTPWKLPIPLSVLQGAIAFWLLWQFAALASAALGQEAMGAGDSMLMAAMGAFLVPWPLLVVAFIFAVLLGTIGGVAGKLLAPAQVPAAPPEPPPHAEAAVGEAGPAQEVCSTEEATVEGRVGVAASVAHQGYEELYGEEPIRPPGEAQFTPAETWNGDTAKSNEVMHSVQPDEAAAASEEPSDVPPESSETVDPEEREAPRLPAGSRWGRVMTVAGSWLAVIGLWGGAVTAASSGPAMGLLFGAVACALAAALLVVGIRMWKRCDSEWLPAMDEFFEEDPGPRFIPFGPYLVAGTLLAILIGRPLVYWYATSQLGVPAAVLDQLPWS